MMEWCWNINNDLASPTQQDGSALAIRCLQGFLSRLFLNHFYGFRDMLTSPLPSNHCFLFPLLNIFAHYPGSVLSVALLWSCRPTESVDDDTWLDKNEQNHQLGRFKSTTGSQKDCQCFYDGWQLSNIQAFYLKEHRRAFGQGHRVFSSRNLLLSRPRSRVSIFSYEGCHPARHRTADLQKWEQKLFQSKLTEASFKPGAVIVS